MMMNYNLDLSRFNYGKEKDLRDYNLDVSRFNHSVNHDNRNYNLDLSRFHYGKQKIHVIITIKSVGTMYRIIVGGKITITGPVATVYPTIVGNKNSIIVPISSTAVNQV